jgi:hypothetical protein
MSEQAPKQATNGQMIVETVPAAPATLDAVIANGASLSAAVEIGKTWVTGLILPAAWTAASLTFQGSVDGTNFYNLYDTDGTEVTSQAAVDRFVRLDSADWSKFSHIKIRSGTSGTPVNQGAARTIKITTRAF